MQRRRRSPVILQRGEPPRFPDPREFDRDGLVAIGGDLTAASLRVAYAQGIFPWFELGIPPMWWSPCPRALLDPEHLHVSRSLARTIRRGGFRLTWNQCFERVMRECGRRRDGGTWIIPEMVVAYAELHRLGGAHSLEVWAEEELVGGIYGVQVGGLFAAESMFHRRTDASKLALVALVRSVFAAGVRLFDVQFVTDHLRTMGAWSVPRADYLQRVAAVRDLPVELRSLRPAL